ncbi:MAG: preprotein translocase subunit SecE [Dissulfurispiraceae bacterium]
MIERLKNFFKEVKVEAKKVNYPLRDELIGSTWVVICAVLFVSVFLGAVDLGLSTLVKVLVK